MDPETFGGFCFFGNDTQQLSKDWRHSRNNADDRESKVRVCYNLEEVGARCNERSKKIAKLDMISNVRSETLDTVGPHHKPYFQGSEAPREWNAPVSEVNNFAGVGRVILEVGWRDRHGADQMVSIFDEATAVGEKPSESAYGTAIINESHANSTYTASMFVRSHLDMLKLKLSNSARCRVRWWYSSHTKAAPAYAASTCTQI